MRVNQATKHTAKHAVRAHHAYVWRPVMVMNECMMIACVCVCVCVCTQGAGRSAHADARAGSGQPREGSILCYESKVSYDGAAVRTGTVVGYLDTSIHA